MRACSYGSLGFAAVFATVTAFAACSGSQMPPSAASPTEPPASAPSSAESAAAASGVPASSAPAAAASAPSPPPAPAGPDRNLNDVRAVIAGNRDAFRSCYDKVQKGHPGTQGDFVLHFVVNPDGTIKSAEADQQKSEIHVPEMGACAIAALKTLKFPPSRKGMETTVNYPFHFTPGGSSSGPSPAHS